MLSIVLYEQGLPPSTDLDFSSFPRGEQTENVPQRKIIFRKGIIFYLRSPFDLVAFREDVCDDETTINANMFIGRQKHHPAF